MVTDDTEETGEKGREIRMGSCCAWGRQKIQKEILIFSGAKRLISEKSWFCSIEQVFFTNGPQ